MIHGMFSSLHYLRLITGQSRILWTNTKVALDGAVIDLEAKRIRKRKERSRQTDGETDRQTDGETDGETDRREVNQLVLECESSLLSLERPHKQQ